MYRMKLTRQALQQPTGLVREKEIKSMIGMDRLLYLGLSPACVFLIESCVPQQETQYLPKPVSCATDPLAEPLCQGG
jgi:hypothetical protein